MIFIALVLITGLAATAQEKRDSVTNEPILPLIAEPEGFDRIEIELARVNPRHDKAFGPRLTFRHYKGSEPLSQIEIEKSEGRYYVDAKRANTETNKLKHWYYLEITQADTARYDSLIQRFLTE
jgi:hypothetical protein